MLSSFTSRKYPINIPTKFHGYDLISVLNYGSFSIVTLVEDQSTHQKYAAKIISKADIENQNIVHLVMDEIDILKTISHPNIIKFYQNFGVINNLGEEYIVIITEYCQRGDLFDFVYNSSFENENEKKKVFYGIAKGVEYLHNRGIAHCDIKPENILLDNNMIPKLCDFGFSKRSIISSNELISGTIRFSSPELLVNGVVNFLKADIWALGITYYFLSLLDFPFNARNNDIAIHQIKNGCLSIDQSDKLQKLVGRCIKMIPEERASINEILNDEFFES